MKKWVSLLLSLLLLLSVCSAPAEALPVRDTGALPSPGEVVHGFEVLEIRDFPLVNATLVLFEHQKTGAKLLYIANEDNNRGFELSFLTRPIDNTGLPHVFEHACLSGSEKYPSNALFMNLSYQTYNTYMNALTTDAMTAYPIASLSEAQLLRYTDYYVDSCLHPRILEDEFIFRTEGWRYRMASTDDPLTLEGTVYSEMLGAYTLERAATLNANSVTFPGSVLGYDYGGKPDSIPDMTWDALKEYHARFYHPSNSVAYLYGDFEDYGAFLALLDEAYAPYEKADLSFTDSAYSRLTAPVTQTFDYPVSAGTDTKNKSTVAYYIVLPGLKGNTEEESVIDMLCSLLNSGGSVLQSKMADKLPSASLSVGREVAAPDDAVMFMASQVNEEDAELFKRLVDESLLDVAENGFSAGLVDSVMAAMNLSTHLVGENPTPVEGIVYNIAYACAVTGDPFDYLNTVDALSRIAEWNEEGRYKKAAKDWLLNRETWTLTTTRPVPGAKEAADAALADRLTQVKASMSEEELQAIVEASNAPALEQDASAYVAQLQAVTVESLPEERRMYEITDVTGEDGIRRVEVAAGVEDIGMPVLLLDASFLPQELIHYFRLYTRLIGSMDTAQHTRDELGILMNRYLNNRTFGIDVHPWEDSCRPYLYITWTAMKEDLEKSYELVEELLWQSDFSDVEKLLANVQAQKSAVRAGINSSPYNIMLYRGLGVDNPRINFISYMNYIDYYAFLEQLEVRLAEDPASVTQTMGSIQSMLHNSVGAISGFAGDPSAAEVNRSLADAFLAGLDRTVREPAVYTLPTAASTEALIVDGNVQYNSLVASLSRLGIEEYDAGMAAVSSFVADNFLIPSLRDQYGVYGAFNNVEEDLGMYLISYRDPNIVETFDVYRALPEMISSAGVDQATLDGYILNAYVNYAHSPGELTGAFSVLEDTLAGKSQERVLDYMHRLKTLTPEAVKEAAGLYQRIWETGIRSTAGSAAAIQANADLYEVILNPFGVKDATQAELTDVTEGSEHYEAVRAVFENGLMASLTEDAFGVDEPATALDQMGALYVLVGGAPGAAMDGFNFFAGYGIIPADVTPETVLTHGLSDSLFVSFGQLAGLPLQADEPNETTDQVMTRGELADALFMLLSALR